MAPATYFDCLAQFGMRRAGVARQLPTTEWDAPRSMPVMTWRVLHRDVSTSVARPSKGGWLGLTQIQRYAWTRGERHNEFRLLCSHGTDLKRWARRLSAVGSADLADEDACKYQPRVITTMVYPHRVAYAMLDDLDYLGRDTKNGASPGGQQ